ncbi:MAG: hypothetical protein AAFO84_13070 [Cyanobacteria bacterium J06598_1]
MTSHSRSTSQLISFGSSAARTSSRASESYSDGLMDDLFGDVDKILDGDLSACMTFVKPQKQPVTASRTVQLPSNFSPSSAADIYRATMAASEASAYAAVRSPQVVSQSIHRQPAAPSANTRHTAYSRGGRPMTSFQATAARSGNFQSTVIQTPVSPSATIDVQSSAQQGIYSQAPQPAFNFHNASPRPPQTIFEPESSQQPVSLPFLLMGAAGISVASTLGLWALGSAGPGGGLLAFNTEASAAELPASEADFLVYLQKSLDNISATQSQTGQALAVIPAPAPAANLPTTVPNVNAAPTAGALPNLPGAAAAAPNVIERVFVPVYENNTANTPVAAAPTNAPVPNVAVPNTAARPTVPVPAPVAAAAALPPGAPVEAEASVPIVPAGNAALPTPAVIAVAPTNGAVTAITNSTPDAEQVLVGVLNLGSRSAALFDVDGNSQRAYVGDRIGTSAWSLVSVNGQDVVIRRDGEVRSVYIGQRF